MKKGIENRVVALDTLTPHKRNYNRHGDAQLADLRESLRQFGQVRSVVVQADKSGKRYTIVAGHGIAEAARAEGYTELRADVIPHSWSDARVLAYLAADNELARHGDPDQEQLAAIVRDVMAAEGDALARLAAGEQAALDAILNAANAGKDEDADPAALVDKAAELQKKWQVARGDVWEIGRHRLMCGDSTSAEDVKTLMQGERARCGMHDPPYGIDWDTDYTRFTNGKKRTKVKYESIANDEKEFDPTHLLNFDQVVLWGANFYSKFLPVGSWLVWDKREQNGTAWLADAEIAWMKGGKGIYICPHRGPIRENRGSHPTQKRADVIAWCMDKAKFANDAIVFDAYCGSGTTLVACEQTGRIGRGMEIEPKYCAVTLERLSLLGLTPRRVES